eukprot:4708662-Pyramimonas_sp.AAC.1
MGQAGRVQQALEGHVQRPERARVQQPEHGDGSDEGRGPAEEGLERRRVHQAREGLQPPEPGVRDGRAAGGHPHRLRQCSEARQGRCRGPQGQGQVEGQAQHWVIAELHTAAQISLRQFRRLCSRSARTAAIRRQFFRARPTWSLSGEGI